MARSARLMLPLALTLLVISPTTLAQQWGELPFFPTSQSGPQQPRLKRDHHSRIDCQINQLRSNEPNIRFEAEAGVTEVWDTNEQDEFHCVGVEVVRHEIEPKGLLLPHYNNAPSVSYIVRGDKALLGVNVPGCPETYESSSSSESSWQESRRSEREYESVNDQHQKIRRVYQGHVIALPAGVSKWIYNDGDERLTIVTLYDTYNYQNQLDDILRSFFLAGSPQGRGGEQGRHRKIEPRHQESRRSHHRQGSQQYEGENIWSGFDRKILSEVLGLETETVDKIQGERDNRGFIVRVEGDLEMLVPEWDQEEQEYYQKQHRGGQGYDRRHRRGQGEQGKQRGEQGSDRRHRGGQGKQSGEQGSDWPKRGGQGEQGYDRRHRGGQGEQRGEQGSDWPHHGGQGEQEYDRGHQHHGGQGYDRSHRGGQSEKGYDRRHRGGQGEQRGEQGSDWPHRGGQGEQGQDWPHHGGQGEQGYDRSHRGGRPSNGLEETICSARLTENIDNPEKADLFNPESGRLTSLNSNKLPILSYLQLSVEKVNLYQNAILAPHWKANAHSIVYFTSGNGRIQIANQEGRLVFDDVVQEGQLLVIPQNFVILKRAGREGLEWVAFLTNDEALRTPLVGRTSAIRGMPLEVVMNSWNLSTEEAWQLKFGRQEMTLFSPSKRSQKRGQQYAIV